MKTMGKGSLVERDSRGPDLQQPQPMNARVSSKRRGHDKQREMEPSADDELFRAEQAEDDRHAEVERFN